MESVDVDQVDKESNESDKPPLNGKATRAKKKASNKEARKSSNGSKRGEASA